MRLSFGLVVALALVSCRNHRDLEPINSLAPAGLRFVSRDVETGFPHVVRYHVVVPEHWHAESTGGFEESADHGRSDMWIHSACEQTPCKLRDWDAFIDRQLDQMFATVEQDHRGEHHRVVIGRQTIYDLRYLLVATWRDGDPELDECEVHLRPELEAALPAFQKACEAATFEGFVRDGLPPEDNSWHPTSEQIMFALTACFASGVVASLIAKNRQRSGLAWFAIGMLLPIIGIVAVILVKPGEPLS